MRSFLIVLAADQVQVRHAGSCVTRHAARLAALLIVVSAYFATAQAAQAQQLQWIDTVRGTFGSGFVTGIAVNPAGSVFVCGNLSGTNDFLPSDTGKARVVTHASRSGYFAKYDRNGAYQWSRVFLDAHGYYPGTPALGTDECIAVDSAGNIFLAGWCGDTADVDASLPGRVRIVPGFFFAKFDSNGNCAWARSLGNRSLAFFRTPDIDPYPGCIFGMKIDSMDNVYVIGRFKGTVDFDPGPDSAIMEAHRTVYSGPGYNDTIENYSVFFAKYDANGNYVWAHSIVGPKDCWGCGIALDLARNVYITGSFTGRPDFDPGPDSAFLGADDTSTVVSETIFFAKYGSDGTYRWAKQLGMAASNDRGITILVDRSGQLWLAGIAHDTLDFDPGPGTAYVSPGETFLARYDLDGNYISARCISNGSDDDGFVLEHDSHGRPFLDAYYIGLALDCADNLYLSGTFQNWADFGVDPNGAPVRITNNDGYGDDRPYFAKFDAAAHCLWVSVIPLKEANITENEGFGHAIAVDDTGSIYVSAEWGGNLSFINRLFKYTEWVCGLAGARILSRDSIDFPTLLCPATERETLWVHNIGNCPLFFSRAVILGRDSMSFSFDSCPSELNPCDSFPIVISFNSTSAGVKVAGLQFTTNDHLPSHRLWRVGLHGVWIASDTTPITLPGVFDAIVASCGEPVDTVLWVYNPRGDTAVLDSALVTDVDAGAITVTGGVPAVIAPGDSVPIHIRFVVGRTARAALFTAYFRFLHNCDSLEVAQSTLRANGTPDSSIVRLPMLEAYAGDTVRIPVSLDAFGCNALMLGATSFRTAVRMKRSLLIPADPPSIGTIATRDRVVEMMGPSRTSPGPLGELTFIAALGDTDSTPLHFEYFVWQNAALAVDSSVRTIDGSFHLLGVCPAGGNRLFLATGALMLAAPNPNPVTGSAAVAFATAESGRTQLLLYDELGRVAATIFDGDALGGQHTTTLNAASLPTGIYLCVLRTSTQRVARFVHIVH